MNIMSVREVLDFAKISYRALDEVNNIRLDRACCRLTLDSQADDSFIQDLTNLRYLVVSYYSTRRGYFSVKYDGKLIEPYDGKYGRGFVVSFPNLRSLRKSTRYYDICYCLVYKHR